MDEVPALTKWKLGGHAKELCVADPSVEGGLRGPMAGERFFNPGQASVLRALGAEGKTQPVLERFFKQKTQSLYQDRLGTDIGKVDNRVAFSAAGEGGKKAFYEGATGKAIAAAVAAEGGLLTEADLAAHHSDFDTAMSVEYHGVEVHKENERVLRSTFNV
jgi:gamma-glutamyltranspeptidase